ncbi:ROK family protein [Candidatus Pacearchaeota archaeon]|nr:ROK family protein [Candidatus Pacearchaeota archaeon]MBD3283517.1 ROK family protein [Candidatus Pacearchaeota archaeon]
MIKKKRVIGVDLGGTNLRVALVENNKVVEYIKHRTPKNQKDLLKILSDSIENLMTKGVNGIGISSAGPLVNGIIKNPPALPFKNFNLKRFLEKKFKKRVEIENDAGCVALAESKIGCKKKNFFILTIGTGIGGGVIIDDKLCTGGNGYGNELGHVVLENGRDFETLWKDTRNKIKKEFGRKLLTIDLIKMNNKKSREILDYLYELFARGIGSLINVFDPEIVVLSGGIRETGDDFLDEVRKRVNKYVIIPKIPSIKWSKLDHPGILGGSLLID